MTGKKKIAGKKGAKAGCHAVAFEAFLNPHVVFTYDLLAGAAPRLAGWQL